MIECSIDIGAPCERVFDVVHDYGIRLRWDTLLSKACITDGSSAAGLGVRTLCVGRYTMAGLGMETVYISFDRPHVAAVRMERGPLFVSAFAASIMHVALEGSASRVTYKFQIRARPRFLSPIVSAMFQRETLKRLTSLKRFIESDGAGIPRSAIIL